MKEARTKNIKRLSKQHWECQKALLVVGQGFNTVNIDSEGLVATEDFV